MIHSPRVIRWVVAALALVAIPALRPPERIEISFVFSPDAAGVLSEPIDLFNDEHDDIEIVPTVESSGVVESGIAQGSHKPVLWMPAASTWGRLANLDTGQDLVPAENPSFFWSPEVFGIWGPVRQAIGEGGQVGWNDLAALNDDDAPLGDSRPFRFGHTKPVSSTSGLYAMVSEYTTAGARIADDVSDPVIRAWVEDFEHSVRHYGDIADDLCGPLRDHTSSYVSALYMQETTLKKCIGEEALRLEIDPVAPSEGTYVADYPCIVLQGSWVSEQERDAAIIAREWLGEHIADEAIEQEYLRVGSPWSLPDVLPIPDARFLDAVRRGWGEQTRKPAHVLVVLERGDAMAQGGRWTGALETLDDLVTELEGERFVDVGLVRFADNVETEVPPGPIVDTDVEDQLRVAFDPDQTQPGSSAGSRLFDALWDVTQRPWTQTRDVIDLVIVVSTGEDDDSDASLLQVVDRLQVGSDYPSPTQLYTIFVGGTDRGSAVLQDLAVEALGTSVALSFDGKDHELQDGEEGTPTLTPETIAHDIASLL